MLIERIIVGELETNCYIVACEKSREAIVIDPGAEPDRILKRLSELGVRCLYIVNTHGHADHIGANGEIKATTSSRIAIHEMDAGALGSPEGNLSAFVHPEGEEVASPPADILLHDGDMIRFGQESLRVIHTPGHTPGGICLVGDSCAFTGDTLFRFGVGRTDLPGGDYGDLACSLEERVFRLPGHVTVYPGHGPKTTIQEEIDFWRSTRAGL